MTKLYQWHGPVKTADTIFATPLSALPFQNDAQAPFRFFSWLVVEIKTDEGHVGYGNAGLCPDITQSIIDTKLAALLIGENPLNTEYLYEKMYRSTVAYGRKGAALAAISAVDIALWDIKGLVMNQPVFMLLGGRTKPSIPTYYSRLYTRNLDSLQSEAEFFKNEGFQGMKMRCGYPMTDGREGLKKNVEMVRLVRETVGDDIDIMLEAYMGFNYSYARQLLKEMEPYNLRWAEELLLPDEIHNFSKLRQTTSVPLSGGEHEYSRFGFHDLIKAEALDIFQFDTNRVGGFTEAQKICNLALVNGIEVIPHGGQMHNLHVVMSSFASPMAEYFPQTEIEVGNEMFWYIFDGEAIAENGQLQLDDNKPGMGLTLKNQYLDQFKITEHERS
ncbi:MAG TPA: enolase C-terminal domain-like protein [Niabella sp.]|nr:enolase C-terminal domain-like protein [Niabella sp.]HQW16367.1 enolase C-terminal domain-like protein [Niabella sp.]HQX21619.1 enolase C-terminal domain-like protein [Niabella sp.]HRB37218.1 enolase C-terminal domain-like protein [Niabella sp.]HRB49235.1 enolase C-terminal domain-like protein [Niabella sp.]